MNQKPQKKTTWLYWVRLVLFTFVWGVVVLLVTWAYVMAGMMVRPAPSVACCETPADYGFSYEKVNLSTLDGIQLSGWYIPSQNGSAVILMHGYGGNRLGMLPQALMLARHGYGVLLYDQRASGESGGSARSWGWQDVEDVQAALDYLETRREIAPGRLGMMGCSTGAEITILAAARYPQISAAVADAPTYSSAKDLPAPFDLEGWFSVPFTPLFLQFIAWRSGVEPGEALSDVLPQIAPRPVLLVSSGSGLEKVQGERFQQMAGENAQLWHIPEASHCGGPQARPQEYEQVMVDFFSRAFSDETPLPGSQAGSINRFLFSDSLVQYALVMQD